MELENSVINGRASIEWLTEQGIVQRKITYNNATCQLIRNVSHNLIVSVSGDKSETRLRIDNINVRNRFMSEGKASIKFNNENCTLFLANIPPGKLFAFLKIIFVKVTNDVKKPRQSLRSQLLDGKSQQTQEVSPLTEAQLNNAKKRILQANGELPTSPLSKAGKRPLERSEKAPAAKKLFKRTDSVVSLGENNIELNDEQTRVLSACERGHNVFFTGSAGTGKSFLLRKIISVLPPDLTFATASTGVAASHIGGVTLHGFAGIGDGRAPLARCLQLASKPHVAQNWRKCKHLIIDEISMVDGEFFEKLEQIARQIRRNDKPFGGIQLILCGDFFQLPPVFTASASKSTRFCFQTPAWTKCVQSSFELRQVHRQSDAEFIAILNSIRVGRVTPEIKQRLTATRGQVIESDGILATRLCSHTRDVDLINGQKLAQLTGESKTFDAQDTDATFAKQLDSQCPAPAKLQLKIGAQVMLVKNLHLSQGLVNGARGVVVAFEDNLPLVRFRSNARDYTARPEKWTIKVAGGCMVTRRQVPLKLAWAFSIHKSQGLTLDCVEMSLAQVFEAGQAYVALSRAKSLDSLRVLDFDEKQVWANPDVLEFYRRFRQRLGQTQVYALGAGPQNRRY